MADGTCSVEGCHSPIKIKSRGYCNKHYHRWRKHGDPLIRFPSGTKLGTRRGTPEQRFWVKVDKHGPVPQHQPELGPCWPWVAAHDNHGYGVFWYRGRLDKAQRVAYILAVGPIPDGLWVLHRCDNPPCVRSDHLFLGGHPENVADMHIKGRAANPLAEANLAKTHCPAGHPYDLLNTYWAANGKRSCRACWQLRDRGRKR